MAWWDVLGNLAGGAGNAYGAQQQANATKESAKLQAEANKYSADIQRQIAERQFASEQALTPLQLQEQQMMADAYRQSYQNTAQQYGRGEQDLARQFDTAAPELEILKQQALTGQSKELQQGTSQLNAILAQQGVRGGQAATQMRRGIGEMTENASDNIQNIMANEAIQRAGEERGYNASKQMSEQQFLLNPQSAQYSQQSTPEQEAYRQSLIAQYRDIDPNMENLNDTSGDDMNGSFLQSILSKIKDNPSVTHPDLQKLKDIDTEGKKKYQPYTIGRGK